jgi:hypothetical protein
MGMTRWFRQSPAGCRSRRAAGPAGATAAYLYRAEAHAQGPVAGTARQEGFLLGDFTSPYPGRVLRWLRRQALRIADGLDPDPCGTPHRGALRPDPGALFPGPGDVPAELRDWAAGEGHRLEARRLLTAGRPFLLLAADHTGRYALTAWPVHVKGPAPSPGFRPFLNQKGA